jgi:hypothetical protein
VVESVAKASVYGRRSLNVRAEAPHTCAEERLLKQFRCGGAMQAVLEFNPRCPNRAGINARAELYLICGDDRFETDSAWQRLKPSRERTGLPGWTFFERCVPEV